MDILRSDIFDAFLLQHRGFPLSEVKNVLVTSVGKKIAIIMEIFSIVSLIWRVCQERFHCIHVHCVCCAPVSMYIHTC